MEKRTLWLEGKTKSLFETDEPDYLIMSFHDRVVTFNQHNEFVIKGKGTLDNQLNAYIMQQLQAAGIDNHFHRQLSEHESIIKRLKMFPMTHTIRNRATGDFCERYGVERGKVFKPGIFELFLKGHDQHGPLLNDSIIIGLDIATKGEISAMQEICCQINSLLEPLFRKAGLILVDYEVTFGLFHGAVLLGRALTLDDLRIWDSQMNPLFDKDRLQEGLGEEQVEENWLLRYKKIAQQLGVTFLEHKCV